MFDDLGPFVGIESKDEIICKTSCHLWFERILFDVN